MVKFRPIGPVKLPTPLLTWKVGPGMLLPARLSLLPCGLQVLRALILPLRRFLPLVAFPTQPRLIYWPDPEITVSKLKLRLRMMSVLASHHRFALSRDRNVHTLRRLLLCTQWLRTQLSPALMCLGLLQLPLPGLSGGLSGNSRCGSHLPITRFPLGLALFVVSRISTLMGLKVLPKFITSNMPTLTSPNIYMLLGSRPLLLKLPL